MSLSLKPERHQCGQWLHRRRDALGDTITCTCNRQYTLRQLTFLLAMASWVRPMYGSYHGHELVWVRNRRAERRDRRFDRWMDREAKRRGRKERRTARLGDRSGGQP